MILIRRLFHSLYVRKYKVYAIIILTSTLIYFLFKWNLFCSDFQAWQHANQMCKNYENGRAIGSLCPSICLNRNTQSFKCHTFGSTKKAVFSVELHEVRVVFKSALTNVKALHWFDNGQLRYPREKDFSTTIQALVRNKLNMTLTQDILNRLTHLRPSHEVDARQRHKEMDNIWTLIQSNEYLLSNIYSDKDIFPQLLGTCGSFFAVEYVEPLEDSSSLLSVGDNKVNWARRLRTSLQILDLLEEFATSFREPYYLCDVKLEHFGIIKTTNKLKFIDLDGVFPNSVLNKIFSQAPKCINDNDCNVYDCKSKCLTQSSSCANYVVNSNLQIVCEKIFLGWRLSNTVMIPGLLISQYTPSELATILRQCANLKQENQKPRSSLEEDLHERLANILIEIEQTVNDEIL